ncbi:MAG: tetratricopeptide repeat-containing sensor histidine kinase [Chitinophagaceae bacterium]
MFETCSLFRAFLITIAFNWIGSQVQAQGLQNKALADSLINEASIAKSDTDQVKLIIRAVKVLTPTDTPEAMKLVDSALLLSQRYHWQKGIGSAYLNKARIYRNESNYADAVENAGKASEIFKAIGWKPATGDAIAEIAINYERMGNYLKAVENNFKALGIYEEAGLKANIAWTYNNIGVDYYWINNFPKAIENYEKALVLQKELNDKNGIASALDNIASVYEDKGDFDKVNDYNLQAIKLFEEINDQPALGRIYINRGNFFKRRNNVDSAIIFYKKAMRIARELGIERTLAFGMGGMGDIYAAVADSRSGQHTIPDSLKVGKAILLQKAYGYFLSALELSKKAEELSLMMQFALSLSATQTLRGNYKSALHFYEEANDYKDSIFSQENERKIGELESQRVADIKDKEIQLLNQEKKLQAAEQEKKNAEAKRIKNKQYFIISALGIAVLAVVIIALLQFRNNRHKQQANMALQYQKDKVEEALAELKSTQAQLIQSAKMASLGELTAGIAHEIQNPLNFVNNFSELSKELLDDMKTELDKGNTIDARGIANDISQNLEKINHHGKRADAIVKGMLQHSSSGGGSVKEFVNINKLANEYMRLCYGGVRAKDKSFQATTETDFDNSIAMVKLIPQDIGRVLLNLYNNAFYAVNEKKKQQGNSYEPTVAVSTKEMGDKIEVIVRDNGNGIPQKIVDKIFQPFFTTKPTGQGTGLGLSLSYDIVKAHGGEIKVETKEGEGSKFIILLPV